ncbi:MAG: hypothetical protein H7Z13_13435 [Ferruginibacter sp.]|nr:hypothetical protein [Ferruginibacter sp.]
MEKQPDTFGSLFENAGDYLETRLDLLKLKAVDKSSDIISSVVSRLTILLIVAFAIVILNIGLAFWAGELLGKVYLGFFVVGGFYALLALILHFFWHPFLKGPISSIIIKKMLN